MKNILFVPSMKDGKQEVRPPKKGEWYWSEIDKDVHCARLDFFSSFPIFTRIESSMKTPDEVRAEIKRLKSKLADLAYSDRVNALYWVLGEEEGDV